VVGIEVGAQRADLRACSISEVLDLVAVAAGDAEEEPPPLVFAWPWDLAERLGANIALALSPQSDPGSSLATHPPMFDSSQPRSDEELVALARALAGALENPGLA
jgi:hypothetical protein